MKRFLFLFCLVVPLCLGQKTNCPSKEDIKPCICKIGEDRKPWITCDGLGSLNVLQKATQRMKGYRFSSLHLDKSNIGVLPGDIFSGIEIQSLSIMFTNLTDLSGSSSRPPFLGLERSLEYLEIRDGFRDADVPLTRLSISHLKKLNIVQLEGNMIPSIGNDWFESGPYGLKELYILAADTTRLGSHAFMSLQNLRKLSLSGSQLQEISRDVFPSPALHLDSIDFSNNKISVLPKGIFARMPSLHEVFFESNDFTTIDQVAFGPIWSQLSHVYFLGNPLKCDSEIKWIFKYRLPESLQGNCAEPAKLQSKHLSNLTMSDFD